MTELLLPRTDAAVVVQAAVLFPSLLVVLALVRRDPEVRLLVVGLLVFSVAFFGLRSVH